LTCQQVRSLLSLYLDGELPEAQRGMVTRHLGECPSCRAEEASLSKTLQIIHAAETIEPPRGYLYRKRSD
jgi:anti-sigma factor RsiW